MEDSKFILAKCVFRSIKCNKDSKNRNFIDLKQQRILKRKPRKTCLSQLTIDNFFDDIFSNITIRETKQDIWSLCNYKSTENKFQASKKSNTTEEMNQVPVSKKRKFVIDKESFRYVKVMVILTIFSCFLKNYY